MKFIRGLRSSTYGRLVKAVRPALNVVLCTVFIFAFLAVSYKLILGGSAEVSAIGTKSSEDSKGGSKNVQAVEKDIIKENGEEAESAETVDEAAGMSGIKVSDMNLSKVKVYITSENRIAELPLEEYIKGVVASEMPLNFNKEALKAQAVAARTYAAAHISSENGCSRFDGADLCDTVHCQVYTSKEKKIGQIGAAGEAKWQIVEEAVDETKGMVLSYKGDLVTNAFYFSTSSGKTESCKDVFSKDVPYLRSVDSPGEESAPRYTDTKVFDFARFSEIINSAYSSAGVSPWKLNEQIEIISRTDGGAVKEIKIGNITMSGVELRKLLGLNSANFTIEFLDNEIVLDCVGYGHGVGMSQWGANIMAQNGSSFEEILKHYYTGVEIETVSEEN